MLLNFFIHNYDTLDTSSDHTCGTFRINVEVIHIYFLFVNYIIFAKYAKVINIIENLGNFCLLS